MFVYLLIISLVLTMTEKTAPWWRSFVGKRRKAARESAANLEQDLRNHSTHQHPSAEPGQQPTSPTRPAKEGGNCLPSDETYDDSAVQPTFNERSNRRNLLVSRSGRFKEKRKTRASLPQNHEDDGKPAAAKSTDVQSTHWVQIRFTPNGRALYRLRHYLQTDTVENLTYECTYEVKGINSWSSLSYPYHRSFFSKCWK